MSTQHIGKRALKLAVGAVILSAATQVMAAEITFYQREGFRGPEFTTNGAVGNLSRQGFNDRASSVVVESGRWEVCEDVRFGGRCMVLRPGSYDTLDRMGMDNRISSVRPIARNGRYANEAPEPLPAPTNEYRRRPDERLDEAQVMSVHAVVGPPERRCWIERQEVTEERRGTNVGGAIAGALIGGILGHQVGGGTGRDIATAGGAVVGGAVGANAGRRGGSTTYDRDVQRCEHVADTTPDYWDVTYDYRGIVHHVQMTSPPGPTITVNRDGEPRA